MNDKTFQLFIDLTIQKLYNIKPKNSILVDLDGKIHTVDIFNSKSFRYRMRPDNAIFIISTNRVNFPTFNIRILHKTGNIEVFLYNQKKQFYLCGSKICFNQARDMLFEIFNRFKNNDQSFELFMSAWCIETL